MTTDLIFIALGLAGLTLGGEFIVRGGLRLSAALGLPPRSGSVKR